MQGCASIFGFSVEQTGVRALIQYARVLLMGQPRTGTGAHLRRTYD